MFEAPKGGTTTGAECEHCGAKLPPPDPQGNRTCEYCGSIYHQPAPAGPQVNIIVGGQSFTPPTVPTYDAAATQQAMAAAGKTAAVSSGAGCLVTLVILVVIFGAVGVAVYAGLQESGTLFGISQPYRVTEEVQALPGEPTGPVQVNAVASRYENGKSNYYVVRADVSTGQTVWQSASMGDKAYSTQLGIDATHTYVAETTRVYAFRNTDGTTAWQASLSDELVGSCSGCFTVLGNRVIVTTRDGVLQAFDTATGAPAWTRRFGTPAGKAIVAGSKILVLDREGTTDITAVVDPATGVEGGRLPATCVDPRFTSRLSTPSTSSLAIAIPGESAVLLGFGTSPTCLQRWDLVTGAQAWNISGDDLRFDSDADEEALFSPTAVYLRTDEGLSEFALATGQAAATYTFDDGVEATPVAVSDQALVVYAQSTRGTTKYSIMGINPLTKAKAWEVAMGTAVPGDGPGANTSSVTSSESRFVTQLDPGVVRVAQVSGETKQLAFSTVDLATGTQSQPKVTTLDVGPGSFSFGEVAWRGERLTANLGQGLVLFDAANGTTGSRWPS